MTNYVKVSPLNPKSAASYYDRGLDYQHKGQLKEAISDYDHALRLNPQYIEAANNRQAAYDALTGRAQASYQKGQIEQAIADYSLLLRLNPHDVTVLTLRGQAYEKKGQIEQAMADYDQALRLNPNHAAAKKSRANMVELLKDAGNDALPSEDRLKKLTPTRRLATYTALFNNDSLLSTLPPTRRAAIGVDLANLGDPRQEIMTVDGMLFCYVPPGPFWMGSNHGEGNEKPLHQLDIPDGYWLGCSLISNAQFQEFVQAGGYDTEKYWGEAKAARVWKMAGFWNKKGQVKGFLDSKWRTAPYDCGEPFNLPNHPVVGVNWYEALAFTRWLTERWGNQISLPSEAEWEKAARGGLMIPTTPLIRPASALSVPQGLIMMSNRLPQRRYPWGDHALANQSNSKEAGIGKTSALGVFPLDKSPYGTQEMAGNVFEWTRSLYQPYPYQYHDKQEQLTAPKNKPRTLRSVASFNHSTASAGCHLRRSLAPDPWGNSGGFRVLCATKH